MSCRKPNPTRQLIFASQLLTKQSDVLNERDSVLLISKSNKSKLRFHELLNPSFSSIKRRISWFSNLNFFWRLLSNTLQTKFSHVLFSFSTFRAGSLVRFLFATLGCHRLLSHYFKLQLPLTN